MMRINTYKFIPAIIWFFVVLVLICLPGKDLPSSHWFDVVYFDKWVHTGLFGLLALLFMLPFALAPIENKEKLYHFIRIAIATSVWGLTTEFIQKYFITGRNFDLFDWAFDSLGSLIAFLFCRKKFI